MILSTRQTFGIVAGGTVSILHDELPVRLPLRRWILHERGFVLGVGDARRRYHPQRRVRLRPEQPRQLRRRGGSSRIRSGIVVPHLSGGSGDQQEILILPGAPGERQDEPSDHWRRSRGRRRHLHSHSHQRREPDVLLCWRQRN